MSFFPRRFAATAVLAALALPVLAQPAPPAAPATGVTAPAVQKMHNWQERRQAHMAQRAAALKAQLRLSPAQEPAWTTFSAAMEKNMPAPMDRQEMAKLTTPERIDRMHTLRTEHAAEADRRGEAVKTFYATLTPEQQKTFDAHILREHPMSMSGYGDGYGHGGPGHHGMRGVDRPAR